MRACSMTAPPSVRVVAYTARPLRLTQMCALPEWWALHGSTRSGSVLTD